MRLLLSFIPLAILAAFCCALIAVADPSPSPSPIAVQVVAQASSNFLANAWHWVWGPGGAILFAVLFGISESLAAIPGVQSNAIYQLLVNGLKAATDKNPLPQKPSQS